MQRVFQLSAYDSEITMESRRYYSDVTCSPDLNLGGQGSPNTLMRSKALQQGTFLFTGASWYRYQWRCVHLLIADAAHRYCEFLHQLSRFDSSQILLLQHGESLQSQYVSKDLLL